MFWEALRPYTGDCYDSCGLTALVTSWVMLMWQLMLSTPASVLTLITAIQIKNGDSETILGADAKLISLLLVAYQSAVTSFFTVYSYVHQTGYLNSVFDGTFGLDFISAGLAISQSTLLALSF